MNNSEHILLPLVYLIKVRDYLKTNEASLWNWFSSSKYQSKYFDSLKLELLKTSYRLDAEAHPELYNSAKEAALALDLNIPITIYQSQKPSPMNSMLYFIPNEAHIVFYGQVLDIIPLPEVKSIIGHELAHYKLLTEEDGSYLTAERVLNNIAGDPQAEQSYIQTALRFQKYTEIYADRGALLAVGDLKTVVAGLVKLETGFSKVNPESYIKQAEEIFSKDKIKTEGLTHPESFIRTYILNIWNENKKNCEAELRRIIEGNFELYSLDVLQQENLTALTRRFITLLLSPKWFQSEAILSQARLYFDDFVFPKEDYKDEKFLDEIKFEDKKLRDYLCYLMLDFAAADDEIESVPILETLGLASKLGLSERYQELLNKELKITKKEIAKLKKQSSELFKEDTDELSI